jgi:hypothetical protein
MPTTIDPRTSVEPAAEPGHRLRHVLNEIRSTELIAVSLCGRQAAWRHRGGTVHLLHGEADCIVCLDLDLAGLNH